MTDDAWKIEAMKATMKNRSTLISLIHPKLLANYKENSSLRDTDHYHPSDMCKRDWCVRQSGYRMLQYPESNTERAKPFQTLNIFEEGHRIHRKWQGWLKAAGVLRGQWFCNLCYHEWYGEPVCEYCQSKDVEYKEVPVYDEEHHILGHADGHLVLPDGDALLEVKSMGIGTFRYEDMPLFKKYSSKEITAEEMWRSLTKPFLSHLRQGTLYMHCTGIHRMIFVYEWKAGQEVREFTVKYQPEVIADILAACRVGLSHLSRAALPPRPVWVSQDKAPCKYCSYRTTCWEDPDNVSS